VEGLDQVVVRAEFEAAHLAHLVAARRQHQHRRIRHQADLLEHLKAVQARHIHVEQRHIRMRPVEDGQPGLAVGGALYLGILPLELQVGP